MNSNYIIPSPVVDKKEEESLKKLTEKYEKMLEPSIVKKGALAVGNKAKLLIPQKVKDAGGQLVENITDKELYANVIKTVGSAFGTLEKMAAKYTLSRSNILKQINKKQKDYTISSIQEISLLRSYDISRAVELSKDINIAVALTEGGLFGLGGFGALPFNIALSMFLYFRAVQNVAVYYGYDVKDNPDELEIASEVFANALSPSNNDANEMGNIIGKVMIVAEFDGLKGMANKTWAEWAAEGGVALFICQLRALANKAAKNALEKAGKKGLEEGVFVRVLTRIGESVTKEVSAKVVPYVAGAVIGAAFDTVQMNKVLTYANIFYQKRFILEKQMRINELLGINEEINYVDYVDADYEEIVDEEEIIEDITEEDKVFEAEE